MDIHPRLAADTHALGTLDGARVLLHRNAAVPWFMLVPDTHETEFLTLTAAERAALLAASARIAAFVQAYFHVSKINFAAIGNVVPQMHLHIVGRDPSDPCWPNPVWGNLAGDAVYGNARVEAITTAMAADCGLRPD